MSQPVMFRRTLLLVTLAVLVGTVVAQVWWILFPAASGGEIDLERIVPRSAAGWEVRDLPVGATPRVVERSYEALQYHAVAYREYRRGGVVLQIYVAYWPENRISYKKIARHIPDGCWRDAGWWIQAKRGDYVVHSKGAESKPGQWRIFSHPNQPDLQVIFWHLANGEPIFYEGEVPIWGADDHWSDWFRQQREQFFIRVSCNVGLEQLFTDPVWVALMNGLRHTGFFRVSHSPRAALLVNAVEAQSVAKR